jgi:hypothetical protein
MAEEDGGYRLEGREIEACDCMTICPCVFGDDPDHGGCQGILARFITSGRIRGVDVSGLTWLEVFQSPGNMLDGNIRKVVFVDSDASLDQVDALRDAFEGRLGGPLADLAALDGERLGVFQAEIECEVEEGEGRLAVTGKLRALLAPRRNEAGAPTTLLNSRFSNIAGTPAWVAKAPELTVALPDQGFQFGYEGRSAIEGAFRFEG